jgi:hypothetical protein
MLQDIPENITDVSGQLEYALRPSGLMVRDVELRASGASRAFVYEAPAMSVNVLTLAKEKPDA